MAGARLGIGMDLAFLIISSIPEIIGIVGRRGDYTTVKVGVGLELDPSLYKSLDFGGNAPGIALFDTNGGRIGMQTGGKYIGHGDSQAIQVNSINKDNNQNPEYITVSQSLRPDSNDICISWMTVAAPSNSEQSDYGLAPGEMAALCNQAGHDYPWYFSNAQETLNGTTVRPKCMMLTEQGRYAGFSAHLIDFNSDNAIYDSWKEDLHQMCDSAARFKMYPSMNEKQCPKVFAYGTSAGAKFPMEEKDACHPPMEISDPFMDPALTFDEARDLYTQAGDINPYPNGVTKWPSKQKNRRLFRPQGLEDSGIV